MWSEEYENVSVGTLTIKTNTKSELLDVLYLIIKYIYPNKNHDISLSDNTLLGKENLLTKNVNAKTSKNLDRIKNTQLLSEIATDIELDDINPNYKNGLKFILSDISETDFFPEFYDIIKNIQDKNDIFLIKSLSFANASVTAEYHKIKSDHIKQVTIYYPFEMIADYFKSPVSLNSIAQKKYEEYPRTKENMQALSIIASDQIYDYQKEDAIRFFHEIAMEDETDFFGEDLKLEMDTIFSILEDEEHADMKSDIEKKLSDIIFKVCKTSPTFAVLTIEDYTTYLDQDKLKYYLRELYVEIKKHIL